MDQQSQARSLPQFLNDRIMQLGTKGFDALILSRGMNPVG